MQTGFRRFIFCFPVFLILTGCTKPVPLDPTLASIDGSSLPAPDLTLTIPGLSPCTTSSDPTIHLNSREPVIVIVHGCKASAARFRSLAQVFAFHGQQAVCFNYNDRASLMRSSSDFINALHLLSQKIQTREITVIGHSQGGLVSRKALVGDRDNVFSADNTRLQLVTISTPYAGITAADHCASIAARFLTLGLAVPICKLISGDKWYEITHPSPFIQKPGKLLDEVKSHLKIVTDETGSCRRYNGATCLEDDFVFSLEEQYFDRVDGAAHLENIEVRAGHSEIVGDYNVEPEKLIRLLQEKEIMRSTLPEKKQQLISFLARLYSSLPEN